ncbi:MAG: hypothetical protein JJE09_01465 [Bacteroidia bacterium]|nr:hypothetical protein [Bacteroidia bacterium]
MNLRSLKFSGVIVFVTLAFIFIPYLATRQGWISSAPSFAIEIVITLGLITSIVFYYVSRHQKSNPKGFIQRYLFSIVIKMMVGCVLVLVVIFNDKAGAMANALLFILSYFTLTGVEIFFLLRGREKA